MKEVNSGMDDDDLLGTIGGDVDDDIEAEEIKKLKKDEAKLDKQLEAMDKKIEKLKGKEEKVENSLDPREEFIGVLKSMGLKKGVNVIADVFFSGDVGNPSHLDSTLVLGGLSPPQRRLIITRYYGESPEQLGIELMSSNKGSGSGSTSSGSMGQDDLRMTAAQMMKERLHAAQTKAMIRELDEIDKPKKEEEKPKPKKVIERPLISRDGEFIMKDGVPVMERIITEGSDNVSSGDGSLTNLIMLMKLMESKKEVAVNPNEKPSWAVELENSIKVNKAEEEKRRLEDELKREREKREDRERELKRELYLERESNRKEIERQKSEHEKEINRQKQDIDYKLTSLKDSFDSEIKHRDTIDSIRDAYGERYEELKKEIDLTKKDIKSAVASEMTKTGSKMIDRMSQTADGVIQPMAEVVKEMYGTQIDMMRKQANLPSRGVPDTNEEELKKLV
jgi:hypothetical protein